MLGSQYSSHRTKAKGAAPPKGLKQWCARPDGTKHGVGRKWYKNGQLSVEMNYRQGKPHGPYRQWHENGHLLETGAYQEGKKHGHFVRYKDGKKVWERDFRDGIELDQKNPDKKWWNQEVELDMGPFEVDLPIWQAAIFLAGLLLVLIVGPLFWRKRRKR